MKIKYRKPTLIEQITDAIATSTAKKPIEAIVLTQGEFQSIYNYLDKTAHKAGGPLTYSYKGIPIKVEDE